MASTSNNNNNNNAINGLSDDEIREFLATGLHASSNRLPASGLGQILNEGTPWAIIASKTEFDAAMATYFQNAVSPQNGAVMRLTDQVAYLLREWLATKVYYPVPTQPQLATLRWRMLTDIHQNQLIVRFILTNLMNGRVTNAITMEQLHYLEYVLETLFKSQQLKTKVEFDNMGEALKERVDADLKRKATFRSKLSAFKHHCLIEQRDIPVREDLVLPLAESFPPGFKFVVDDSIDQTKLKRGTALVIRRLRPEIDRLERLFVNATNVDDRQLILERIYEVLREERMLIANWKRTVRKEQAILNDPYLKDVVNSQRKRFRDEDTTYKRTLFLQQLHHTGQTAPTPEDRERAEEMHKRVARDIFYTDTSSLSLPDQEPPILPDDMFVRNGIRTRFGGIVKI